MTNAEKLKNDYLSGWNDPFDTASWINWDAVDRAIEDGTLPEFLYD